MTHATPLTNALKTNPFTINNIDVANNTLYLATRDGLFISSNQGKTWTKIYHKELQQIAVDQDTIYIRADDTIQRSDNQGKTWVQLPTINPGLMLCAITIYNHQLYVGADPGLYTFKNGTWIRLSNQSLPVQYATVTSIATLNNTIYTASQDGKPDYGYYTTDPQGKNWTKHYLTNEESSTIQDMQAMNNMMYIIGDDPITGQTALYQINGPTPNIILDQHWPLALFSNHGKLFVICEDGLRESSDNGDTWKLIFNNTELKTGYATNGTIYVADKTGHLFVSQDNGASWQNINYALTVSSIAEDQDGTLYTATNNGIRISHDQGKTWTTELTGKLITLVNTNQKNHNIVYAALNNQIWFSKNDGQQWRTLAVIPDDDAKITALYANGQDLVIGTNTSKIYTTTDDFKTPVKIITTPLTSETQTLYGRKYDKNIYLGSSNNLFYSMDQGLTWRPLPSQALDNFVFSIYANGKRFYVAEDSQLLNSKDNGHTWAALPSTKSWWINQITGANNQLFAIHQGILSETVDQGITWTTIPVPSAVKYVMIGKQTLYIGTEDIGLYKLPLNSNRNTVQRLF